MSHRAGRAVWKLARIMPCAIACCFALRTAHAQPLNIRIGWIVAPDAWAPLLAAKPDLMQHAGHSYTITPVHFQATPMEVTAMATGDLDIGDLTYATFAIAIRNAKMDDIRVIADEMQDGVPGYWSNQSTVLKDSPIRTIEDLKGKILAVNATGSAGDMTNRAMLAQHHIDMRDVTVIETNLANMNAMLESKKIDLASSVPPFALDPGFIAQRRVLFTQADAFGGKTQFSFWTARASYIAAHRAALLDLMEDSVRTVRWFLDPANHAQAVTIAANVMKQSPDNLQWAFTKDDYFHDPDMKPDLVALQRNVDFQRDLGFVKGNVDVASHADLALLSEATARLTDAKGHGE
jgi:sulfonate transport system substrate-binding protein